MSVCSRECLGVVSGGDTLPSAPPVNHRPLFPFLVGVIPFLLHSLRMMASRRPLSLPLAPPTSRGLYCPPSLRSPIPPKVSLLVVNMDQVNEAHARVNEMHGRLQVGGGDEGGGYGHAAQMHGRLQVGGGGCESGRCAVDWKMRTPTPRTITHPHTLLQAKQAEAVRSGLEDAAAAERIAIEAVQARIGALRQERERLTVARCVGRGGEARVLRQEMVEADSGQVCVGGGRGAAAGAGAADSGQVGASFSLSLCTRCGDCHPFPAVACMPPALR